MKEEKEEKPKCLLCKKEIPKKCNFFRQNGDFGFGKGIDLKISLRNGEDKEFECSYFWNIVYIDKIPGSCEECILSGQCFSCKIKFMKSNYKNSTLRK